MSTVLTAIIVAGLSSAVVSTVVSVLLEERRDRRSIRWEHKRQACLDALRIVDGIFSHYDFVNEGVAVVNSPQPAPTIAEIRDCHDRLSVACERPEVLIHFQACLGLLPEHRPVRASHIADLRRAVRAECGLPLELGVSDDYAWIAEVQQASAATDFGAGES